MNDNSLKQMAIKAKASTFEMGQASCETKNKALKAIVKGLKNHREQILQANNEDIALAKTNNLNGSLIDRLSLQNRLDGIIEDVEQVILLPDPIGETFDQQTLPNHLKISKCRVPLGVLGIIYESRPNVTIDISVLSIKSGNCAILKGGSETLHTNRVLVEVIQRSLSSVGLPSQAIQLICSSDRAQVKELLSLNEYIDLIIPRGSETLQKFCRENSTIPVITGGVGICHLFVDESADLEKSLNVIINAKTQRPTVCNALDTLLVHSKIGPLFIPKLINILRQKGVSFKLDPLSYEIMRDDLSSCNLANPQDWDTEWLSLTLGVKVVKDLKEALHHIRLHSTGHSDGILTENDENGLLFVRGIDSAAVYVNASTRFTDGGQLGLGSEVAISTQKLHARGPMGLKELTSYKWVVKGNYQVRK